MDPRARLALLFAAGLLAITLERPLALAALALACTVPLLFVGVSGPWLRRGTVAVLTIIWSTSLSQSIFYAEQPRVALLEIGPLVFWREGLRHGMAQSLRFVGLSLAGLAVAVSTPPDRLHAALRALRVPFGLALMASTALRFLPAITQELRTVRLARAARGRPVWQRSPIAWLRLELSLLRPVVARAWRRAHNLAESLDARGFDPTAPRTERRPLRMSGLDQAVVASAALLCIPVVLSRLLYILYTSETWYHPALRPVYGLVRTWL